MNVTIAVPSVEPRFGGPSAKALALAREMRARGHTARVVGCGSAPDAIGLPIAAYFHTTPIPWRFGPLLRAVRSSDIVHVIGYRDPVGTFAGIAANRRHIPWLLEPAGMYRPAIRSFRWKSLYQRVVGDRLTRSASAFVATSSLEADQLRAADLTDHRIFERPNGVQPPDLQLATTGAEAKLEVGVDPDLPMILSLGRIAIVKRLEHVVAAAESLGAVTVVIAGRPERDGTVERLRRAASDLGLTERVKIIANGIWGEEKARFIAAADCFCMSSETENFGTAAAEAASVGKPVVISDRCGVAAELAPFGAFVYPFGDISALANALTSALSAEARENARRNAAAVTALFDWSSVASQQEDIYRRVLDLL